MLSGTIKDVFLKQKVSKPIDYRYTMLSTMVKNPILIFSFKNVVRTGVFLKKPAYNQLFFKVKSNLYAPLIQKVEELGEIKGIEKHKKSEDKIIKYYTGKVYKNIKDVHIVSEDPYLALPHVLAYWPDYDLLKTYYKNLPLEEIDCTLWGFYLTKYLLSWICILRKRGEPLDKNLSPEEKLFLASQRFNLLGLIYLFDNTILPVIYKDGLLLADYYNPFTSLSNFGKPTIKEVIKTILRKITNPKLLDSEIGGASILLDKPLYKVFPYTFTIGLTDYGYVLNLYKFNFETLEYNLIYAKPVYTNHTIFNTDKRIVKLVDCTTINEFDLNKREWKGLYFIGIDDKYVYLTEREQEYCQPDKSVIELHVYKIPVEKIDWMTANYNFITMGYKTYFKRETTLFAKNLGIALARVNFSKHS